MTPWIEAMRPRTLPVSVAGVMMGWGCAAHVGMFRWWPALACLAIAVSAQIASNFGNEYFDFRRGLDKKGRSGFRRGVTEGDISPRAMMVATLCALAVACVVGLALTITLGCWWLLIPGGAIAVFALAYSEGPYPLSHHGLGDIAVVIFFGLVPVSLTCYVVCGSFGELWTTWGGAAAVGLLAANVLIVNNYRDSDDDREVGKNTTVVIFGRKAMSRIYLIAGLAAMVVAWQIWYDGFDAGAITIPLLYLSIHISLWRQLKRRDGAALNPLLGMTAANLLIFSLLTAMLLAFA